MFWLKLENLGQKLKNWGINQKLGEAHRGAGAGQLCAHKRRTIKKYHYYVKSDEENNIEIDEKMMTKNRRRRKQRKNDDVESDEK